VAESSDDALARWGDEITSAINLVTGGDLDAAQRIFETVVQEVLTGIDDVQRESIADVTVALQRFGEACLRADDLGRAGFLHEAAIHLRRAAGLEDAVLAKFLGLLAVIFMKLGGDDLPKAEPLLQEAYAIQQRTLPAKHIVIAETLQNFGAYYQHVGRLDKARDFYRLSLDLQNQLEGPRDPIYEITTNNLAILETRRRDEPAARVALEELLQTELSDDEEWLRSVQLANAYARLRDFDAAEPLAQKLREMARSAGERSRRHGLSLSVLAEVREGRGQLDDALSLRLQSLESVRGAADATPADLSAALNNLGSTLLKRREIPRSIPYLEEALALKRADLGGDASELAANLSNLALAYIHTDRAGEATPLMEEALSLRRAVLPEGHVSLSQSLFNLGLTHVHAARFDAAIPLLREQLHHEQVGIDAAFSVGSERERLTFVRALLDRLDTMNEMLFTHAPERPEVAALLFEAAVQRKGLVGARMAAERDAAARGHDPDVDAIAAELKIVRERIAEVVLGRATASADELETMRDGRRDLERRLARAFPALNVSIGFQSCDRFALAAALPPRSALFEIVRFAIGRGGPSEENVYVLFVLPDREPEKLTMIVLGVEKDLGPTVAEFRELIASEIQAPERRDDLRFRRNLIGVALWHFHILRRSAAVLGDRRKLLICPDGIFHRFPFDALSDEDAQPLFETYEISYLDSGRDLLRIAQRSPAPTGDPIVIANPDFNLGGTDRSIEEPYPPLPGTLFEGERVAALLQVKAWTGAQAVVSRLKAARSPRILHLATHGFFEPDPSEAEVDLDAAMLGSGLAFAGANTDFHGGTLPAEADDGVLYAQDVLSLDLSGTELVVLSACETGLGAYQRGEGLFGLRRAFMVAGARSLLVSLWEVGDNVTAILMENFYRALLAGSSRIEALRIAQRAVREFDDAAGSWAAFICVGDPGPLAS
jgi:tetratricopeptide (TPR) repeat protein